MYIIRKIVVTNTHNMIYVTILYDYIYSIINCEYLNSLLFGPLTNLALTLI